MLRAAILDTIPHGFSTRTEPEIEGALPGAPVILAKQVHSPNVLTVAAPWQGAPQEADALATDRPGLLIGVVTADCAPVLLADAGVGVVGAAHAGWRGALSGVLENTVAAMTQLGARRNHIAAAIGPTIAQTSYEVDETMRRQFPADADRFFTAGMAGRWVFDLPGFVEQRLREAGVRAVENLGLDTYAHEDRFFSYRRATHRGEPTGGRQTSVIGLS